MVCLGVDILFYFPSLHFLYYFLEDFLNFTFQLFIDFKNYLYLNICNLHEIFVFTYSLFLAASCFTDVITVNKLLKKFYPLVLPLFFLGLIFFPIHLLAAFGF